jgi:hypothetical protein
MADLVFPALAAGFFAAAVALTHGYEKLRGGSGD